MEPQTAKLVLYTVTTIGFAVWVFGLQFLINTVLARRSTSPPDRLNFDTPGEQSGTISGSLEVEGDAEQLTAKAAAALAKMDAAPLGLVKVLRRTENEVEFETTATGGSGGGVPVGSRIRLRFAPSDGGRARADYDATPSPRSGLVWAGAICQALGFLALVGGFLAIHAFVVDHPNPAVRGQTFQMVQVVHFLWPPFLFGGLYRAGRRQLRDRLEALIHNLPYRTD